MAKRSKWATPEKEPSKKKTRQGNGKHSKHGSPGPNGGNKGYKKKSRGQGK